MIDKHSPKAAKQYSFTLRLVIFSYMLLFALLVNANTGYREFHSYNQKAVTTYALGQNETTYNVANKFNISFFELKQLNKTRQFNVPFERLYQGATIYLPAQYTTVPPSGYTLLQPNDDQLLLSNNETLFTVGITYEIDIPENHQITPSYVAYKRTLAGNRYKLINRNSQSVLNDKQGY